MHIVVVGVDHTTAPIALRERLSCSTRRVPQLLQAACQGAQECVLLSTCNRLELYAVCSSSDEGRTHLLHVLSETRQVDLSELMAHSYSFADQDAVSHLLAVACGLHSLVPGEPQIQGQVAEALELAQASGYAGPITSALFRAALVTGKRARSETGISRNAVSISHVAVQLARQLFPRLNDACVLLVGSGQMSEVAARNLRDNGARRLLIVNRTDAHAQELAQHFGALHRPFSELAPALIEADVVISSTRAPRALITLELMQEVLSQRPDRSLLLIDIALPRDVDPAVAGLPGVHLYNLDDLHAAVNEGMRLRLQEVQRVQEIVTHEGTAFERWLRSLSVVDTISELRQHVDEVRQQELARTLRQLSTTLSEREAAAVQELTTRLMNKLLHTPTLRLKDAAAAGQGHLYAEALRYLFDLEAGTDTDEADHHWHPRQQTGDDPDGAGQRAAAAALAQPEDPYRANSHQG
ncbi:MAG: glutamyl-tRNA reductase [Ktedonobacteraceae bacterium]|nr:glutamyl-tRNA reductase [Ktedonobacteraceae bacterium]